VIICCLVYYDISTPLLGKVGGGGFNNYTPTRPSPYIGGGAEGGGGMIYYES